MADKIQIKKSVKQQKDPRPPFRFLLELKDLTNPITIKRIQILKASAIVLALVVVGYVAWDKLYRAPTGDELVGQLVEAAGGMEAWNNIDHGTFNRTHRVFSETGELLSERVEKIFFEKINGRVKLMADVETPEGEILRIAKDKTGYWAVQNNNVVDPGQRARELGMSCENHKCDPDCSMNMAFYRFSMPFKLKDDGVIAENGGTNSLDGKMAQVLNISYRPDVGRDKWVFYAHPEDNLIRKMEYHQRSDHGDVLPVEFLWSDYADEGGIMISHRWTRYWSNGKVLEEYTFSDFNFQRPLPDQFHERPEHLAGAY